MLRHLELNSPSNKIEKRLGKPFVTISFEVGAYGASVIEGLCQYLRKYDRRKKNMWKVYDKDLAEKVVEVCELPRSVLPYFSESTASGVEDSLEFMVGLHPSRHTLVYNMNKTIFRLAESGYSIIVGRGSNIITTKLPKGIHVRLIGSLENRINYFKEYFKIEEKEAREFIAKENRRRSDYFKKYFERNINDSLLYDSVINTDRLTIQDIVRQVGVLVLKREMSLKI